MVKRATAQQGHKLEWDAGNNMLLAQGVIRVKTMSLSTRKLYYDELEMLLEQIHNKEDN